MKNVLQKIKNYIPKHKIISAIIILVLLLVGYYVFGKVFAQKQTVQYMYSTVKRGDLTLSVSGSGQVATLSQVDIKAKSSGQTQNLGQIISVRVNNGDMVYAGQVIAILDGKNALQSLNQAKASVASAQANYNKLINGPTASELLGTNNSIQSAETSIENLKQNILIKLRSAYSGVSNSVYLNTDPLFIDPLNVTPQISVDGVIFLDQQLVNNVNNDRSDIGTVLTTWKTDLNNLTTSSDLVSSINSAITNLNKIRNYFDDMTMLFASYSNSNSSAGESAINTDKGIASAARASADSSISDLTSVLQSYNSAQISLEQSNTALSLKTAAPSVDDVTVAKSVLDNANANLANAEEAYASRIITAPFSGQVGGLTAQVGQQISSADSIGKIITSQKVVAISLNEVDAAKIAAGEKVTLTYDALPGVTSTGHVVFIDPLGTVSQGVVSYNVRVSIDEKNDDIKTGMTASAEISTQTHTNVLLVPNSAITTVKGKKYVLVTQIPVEDFSSSTFKFASSSRMATSGNRFASSTQRNWGDIALSHLPIQEGDLRQFEVTVGITDGINTEIVSGIEDGEIIVLKSTGTKTSTKNTVGTNPFAKISGGGNQTRVLSR